MPKFARGIGSDRDRLVVDFEADPILKRMRDIADSDESDDELCDRIGLNRKRSWNFEAARKALDEVSLESFVRAIAYRPFDRRQIFFHSRWIASASLPVMRNVVDEQGLYRPNLLLIAGRLSRDKDSFLYWASRDLVDKGIISSVDNVSVFPAVTYAQGDGDLVQEVNFSPASIEAIEARLGMPLVDARSPLEWAEGVISYIYALLWAPAYRVGFAPNLFKEFPRIPFTADRELAGVLREHGAELLALHLMEGSDGDEGGPAVTFFGPEDSVITGISRFGDRVEVAKEAGFEGVTEMDWQFKVGGYSVLEKWLKDRAPRRGQSGGGWMPPKFLTSVRWWMPFGGRIGS